jgi:hypothetical protein
MIGYIYAESSRFPLKHWFQVSRHSDDLVVIGEIVAKTFSQELAVYRYAMVRARHKSGPMGLASGSGKVMTWTEREALVDARHPSGYHRNAREPEEALRESEGRLRKILWNPSWRAS